MLKVEIVLILGDRYSFDLYIESSKVPIRVVYCRRTGQIEADRMDYEAQDYIRKAIRKLESLLPRPPKSFKMMWY